MCEEKKKKKKLSILEAENQISFDETSIDFWHNSPKLSSTNNVLVAFAWAHDDELRNVEMFPEILGIDVTFGVNKERRDLLIAAGVDDNKKTFSAFCCFILSKKEATYTWIINQAITHLITPSILRYNSCIDMDQEFALNSSIKTTIDSANVSFANSKILL
jgi:hypothetical protein